MRIKRGFLACLLGLLSSSALLAQEGNLAGFKPADIEHGAITILLPQEFKPVSLKSFDFIFERRTLTMPWSCCLSARIYALADEKRSLSFILSFFGPGEVPGTSEKIIEPEMLPEIKKLVEKRIEKKSKGVSWEKRELINMNDTRWMHLVFETKERGIPETHDMYLTAFEAYLMVIDFNATAPQYRKYKDILAQAAASIRIKPAIFGDPRTGDPRE